MDFLKTDDYNNTVGFSRTLRERDEIKLAGVRILMRMCGVIRQGITGNE